MPVPGGLGRFVSDLTVRFAILPDDPEARVIDPFEKTFVDGWGNTEQLGLPTGLRTDWGHQVSVTRDAIVRYENYSGSPWVWDSYLALHRHGGVEFAVGMAGTFPWRREAEDIAFRLVACMGRVWNAVALQTYVNDRFDLCGEFKALLAFYGTKGSLLGNLANGWSEPGRDFRDPPPCPDEGVLITREIVDWPSTESTGDLMLVIGAAVENAWGTTDRRFIARQGENAGQFDVAAYR